MTALSFQENRALLRTDAGMALLAHVLYQPTEEKILARAVVYAENPLCRIFYALEDDRPMALCILKPDEKGMEILALSVAADRRRQGIGRKLITHIQRIIGMPLTAETDDDAVGFYRRCGFSVISLGEKYPGVIRYRCILFQEA